MAQVTFTSNLGVALKATKEQLQRAGITIGMMAESYAKQACPVDTGNLRNSITNQYDPDEKLVMIGSNVSYAPFVELGVHKPHRNPQPYLRPAIENHKDEYKKVIETELQG